MALFDRLDSGLEQVLAALGALLRIVASLRDKDFNDAHGKKRECWYLRNEKDDSAGDAP
jgi:hypothetical protein